MTMLNINAAAIDEAMKLEKMYPYGSSPADFWTDLMVGAQKTTKRYIDPSNIVDANPRTSIDGLFRVDQTSGFLDLSDDPDSFVP